MPFTTKYTEEEKLSVCNYYVVTGSAIKASKASGVPQQTIRAWTKTEWWNNMIGLVRGRLQDKLDGKFTGMIQRMLSELEDSIKNGDEILNGKTGEIIRKRMSGRDLVGALAIIIDKRALLRGDPTSHKRVTNIDKKMAEVQKKLELFQEQKKKPAEEGMVVH